MCCTKYGEDGQSALILDKEKNRPTKANRKGKKMLNKTNTDEDQDQFAFPADQMTKDGKSRNHGGMTSDDNSTDANGY